MKCRESQADLICIMPTSLPNNEREFPLPHHFDLERDLIGYYEDIPDNNNRQKRLVRIPSSGCQQLKQWSA